MRMRAQSHAARRAPPSPWTTACARRSDSSRWPGTLPVPSVVPYATFVTCKCRSECTCGAVRGLGMLYCPWGRRSRHVRALGRPTISAQSPFPQMQPRYPMCRTKTREMGSRHASHTVIIAHAGTGAEAEAQPRAEAYTVKRKPVGGRLYQIDTTCVSCPLNFISTTRRDRAIIIACIITALYSYRYDTWYG